MPPALRADQVGALLRPEKLLEARALNQGAQLDRDGLTRAEELLISALHHRIATVHGDHGSGHVVRGAAA